MFRRSTPSLVTTFTRRRRWASTHSRLTARRPTCTARRRWRGCGRTRKAASSTTGGKDGAMAVQRQEAESEGAGDRGSQRPAKQSVPRSGLQRLAFERYEKRDQADTKQDAAGDRDRGERGRPRHARRLRAFRLPRFCRCVQSGRAPDCASRRKGAARRASFLEKRKKRLKPAAAMSLSRAETKENKPATFPRSPFSVAERGTPAKISEGVQGTFSPVLVLLPTKWLATSVADCDSTGAFP